jgi:hypothetical protein
MRFSSRQETPGKKCRGVAICARRKHLQRRQIFETAGCSAAGTVSAEIEANRHSASMRPVRTHFF